MTATTVTTLDLRVIESVLQMGTGYVLDFNDKTFAAFFKDFGVNIDDPRFSADGGSKAKRLRCFLRTTPPPLSGRVLAELLQHRLAIAEELPSAERVKFGEIVARLGGSVASAATSAGEASAEADLLGRVFKVEVFEQLPLEAPMTMALVARMHEAHRCMASEAHLAAVILCGSVLEGMCLGFGSRHPERVNRAYHARYNREPPRFPEWRLAEWIDVLARVGDLSPNIEKFGHALRDFRNYVHPAEQLAHRFSPDPHTSRIGFQVVIAAAEDLLKASRRLAQP